MLLEFTGIHYLWIARISYIVIILLYILSNFPHANIHYILFSLNILFCYLFFQSQNVIFWGEICLMLILYPTWCLSTLLEHRVESK